MTTTHERQSEPLTRDDVIATGVQVVLRRKRVDDAPADYSWRRDEALARYARRKILLIILLKWF